MHNGRYALDSPLYDRPQNGMMSASFELLHFECKHCERIDDHGWWCSVEFMLGGDGAKANDIVGGVLNAYHTQSFALRNGGE